MKTLKVLFRLSLALIFAMALAITFVPGLGDLLPSAVATLFGVGSGLSMAVTAAGQAVEGTVDTNKVATATPNLLRPEISQLITKIRPDVFALDTIMREIGNVGTCDSREYKYYSTDVRGVQDTTTAAVAQADTLTISLPVTNPHIWTVDDVIFIPSVVNNSNQEIRAQVLAKAGSNLTVSALNGVGAGGAGEGDFMPTIPISTSITRIGNAKDETAAQTTAYANMPSDTYNYVQIFMAQVEETFVNLQHNKEVEYNLNDYKTDAIYDMRRQGELSMLFGFPKKDFYDSVNEQRKDFMGGARHFITKTIDYIYTTEGTNADFNSWARQIFTGNNGSYTRILFAGNGLVEWLMNIPVVEKQLQADKSEIVAGIKFKLIETYFGDLLVRRHQGFDDVEGYTYHGLVLDLENVERRFREATNTTELELDKTGVKRVNATRIVEAWTMAFRNPETHAWIEGAAA